MDFEKQIKYWSDGSASDLETADLLIKGKKKLEGLFFCHLCIEKIIKALIVKNAQEIPPKSHDLLYLRRKSGIELSIEQTEFLQILMIYQLEGRYPEYYPTIPIDQQINDYFLTTKELLKCLKEKL